MEVQRMRSAKHTVQDRIVARFCACVTYLVFGALAAATISYEVRLLRTSTVAPPYPMTIYQPMATPGTSRELGVPGAAGADFSQVYTSASALRHGESAYRPKSREFVDRFGRPPGYPPLMNWVGVPLSLLEYTDALMVYTALALLILLSVTALLLAKAGLGHHIGRVVLAQVSLYFLTPIGVTHLERGQFDALVATAGALCVGCVFSTSNTWVLAAVAGLLGALKWTSISFLGCFSVLGFLLSAGAKRWIFFLIPSVTALGTLPFFSDLVDYWKTIRFYEIDATPYGLTLQHFLPRALARSVPIAATMTLVALSFIRFRSSADRAVALREISAPFAITLMNLAICFGTLSYEYHTVATLGMIPGLVIWIRSAQHVPTWMRASVSAAFALFLVIAFRSYGFGTTLTPLMMTGVYAGFAALFFASCVLTVLSQPRAMAATQSVDLAPLN